MKRGETIQLLRQILNRCSPTSIGFVSLIPPTPNNGTTGYELKFGTTPNIAFRESSIILLKEKGLEMKENENFITIYKAKQNNYYSHV